MTAPITAWRYWRVVSELQPVGDNLYSYNWHLSGDFEKWDSPLKEAGHHDTSERISHILNNPTMAGSWVGQFDMPIPPHDSPAEGCLCGVNAVKRLRSSDLLMRIGSGWGLFPTEQQKPVAFAQVDLGGKVDEYEQGYRAQQALISGPIYVVNPPEQDGWREAIERLYGQPVIVQDASEAMEWIRKDEEHGHREAHQNARTRAFGGPVYHAGGTVSTTVSTGLGTVYPWPGKGTSDYLDDRVLTWVDRLLIAVFISAVFGAGLATGGLLL
jgi:hypothetical protein